MEFIPYPDSEMMMMQIANRLAGELRSVLAVQERVSLAVPGGTTPGPVFDSLCAVDLDWDRVDIMLTDERWVSEDSSRSNTRLLRNRLLINHAKAAQLVPLYAAGQTPDAAVAQLSERVSACLPLSVCLLGMGEDRDIASIFAGGDNLQAALTGDQPLVVMRGPQSHEPRVTLSAKVLQGAVRRHILIIGAAKRAALETAKNMTSEEAPVNAVLKGAIVHWAEG